MTDKEFREEALRLAKACDENGLTAMELCDEAAFDLEYADAQVRGKRFKRRAYVVGLLLLVCSVILFWLGSVHAVDALGIAAAAFLFPAIVRGDFVRPIDRRRRLSRETYILARGIRKAIDEASLVSSEITPVGPPPIPKSR